MSAPGSLSAAPTAGALDISPRTLDVHSAPARSGWLAGSRLGWVGLGAMLLSTLLISLGAAHTDALVPQSVRPLPGWLAGPFGSAGLHLDGLELIGLFTLLFAGYVLSVRAAPRIPPAVLLMAIAALYALVLLAPPLLSTDVFSYQAYARIWGLHGANPYLQGPHAIALDPLYPFIGAKWVTTPSVYGPLFTVPSLLSAHLSIAASALAFKVVAALAGLVMVALVWNAARLRGRDPGRAAALVALNPLVLIYGVGGAHNDLLMLALLVAGVYALLAHRDRAGGALPVLAGAVKLTGGLFLPFMLASAGGLGGRSRQRNILWGAALAFSAMLALGLGVFGFGQLHLLSTLQETQSDGDWHSIAGFISSELGLGTVGRIAGVCLGVAFLAVFAWLLLRVRRGELDWIDGCGWTTVALLVSAGSMLPWYVAWLMPFAALGRDPRLWRTSLVVSGVVQAIQLTAFLPHAGGLTGL